MAQQKGQRDQIERALKALQSKEARIGFFPQSQYEDGTPVAYVATIHEHGYPEGGIPSRPFMRPTFDERRAENRDQMAKGIRAVLNGRIEAGAMLHQLGLANAGAVSTTISRVTAPTLSDATIAARASRRKSPGVSDKPLVDSGLLIKSVTSEVVDV